MMAIQIRFRQLFGSSLLILLLTQISFNLSEDNAGTFQIPESFIITYMNTQLQDVFAGDIKAGHYSDAGSSKTIDCATDLACSFSAPCKWRNVKESNLHFYEGTGQPDAQLLDILTGVSDMPEPPYLIAASQESTEAAWLASNPIPNQLGEGLLEFKYWLSPNIQLRVCVRSPGSKTLDWCSTTFESGGGGEKADKAVKIPGPQESPFEIVIEISHFEETAGMGIVDDIVYSNPRLKCSGASSSTSASTSASSELSKPATPSPPSEKRTTTVRQSSVRNKPTQIPRAGDDNDPAICSSVNCDFDQDRTCGYHLDANSKFPFKRQDGNGIKPASWIPKSKRGYVIANGTIVADASSLFVLESSPFPLTYPVDFQFLRWQKGQGVELSICVNSVVNCVASFKGSTGSWSRIQTRIAPRDTNIQPVTLMFVAEGLSAGDFVAIDEIEVLSADCGQ